MSARTKRGERGSVLLLSLGALAVAAALVVTVAVVSALYLDRRELLSLADASAAHAASALDPAAYAAGDLRLTDAGVRRAVDDLLRDSPTTLSGVVVAEPTGTPDGRTAQVTLRALARPGPLPWALAPWSKGITIEVTALARGG